MRLFQLKNVIFDDPKIIFNVKGCDPQYCKIYTWSKLKSGFRLHG